MNCPKCGALCFVKGKEKPTDDGPDAWFVCSVCPWEAARLVNGQRLGDWSNPKDEKTLREKRDELEAALGTIFGKFLKDNPNLYVDTVDTYSEDVYEVGEPTCRQTVLKVSVSLRVR